MSSQDRSETVAGPASNGGAKGKTLGPRLQRMLIPGPKLGPPINPALLKREEERAEARQNRLADKITAFSGSMLFVYAHVIWFACWIGFGAEDYPYGLLTMIVSLEAIFLRILDDKASTVDSHEATDPRQPSQLAPVAQ